MSNASLLPSHFGFPFLTTISDVRYDSKGRQLSFVESDAQRLERLAFVNAAKSRSNSPTQSPQHSRNASPRMKLISEPYGDPIELMANRIAEEFMLNSSDDSSSDDEPYVLYSTPKPAKRVPFSQSRATASRQAPLPSTTFQPGHRRKRSSLSAIVEED